MRPIAVVIIVVDGYCCYYIYHDKTQLMHTLLKTLFTYYWLTHSAVYVIIIIIKGKESTNQKYRELRHNMTGVEENSVQ